MERLDGQRRCRRLRRLPRRHQGLVDRSGRATRTWDSRAAPPTPSPSRPTTPSATRPRGRRSRRPRCNALRRLHHRRRRRHHHRRRHRHRHRRHRHHRHRRLRLPRPQALRHCRRWMVALNYYAQFTNGPQPARSRSACGWRARPTATSVQSDKNVGNQPVCRALCERWGARQRQERRT